MAEFPGCCVKRDEPQRLMEADGVGLRIDNDGETAPGFLPRDSRDRNPLALSARRERSGFGRSTISVTDPRVLPYTVWAASVSGVAALEPLAFGAGAKSPKLAVNWSEYWLNSAIDCAPAEPAPGDAGGSMISVPLKPSVFSEKSDALY